MMEEFERERPKDGERLGPVRKFAQRCHYEAGHSEHVTQLAQRLFEQLSSEHALGKAELFLLTCAGILHDIGYPLGAKGHHKAAMEMILEDSGMPLTDWERRMVAVIARYHRKALPGGDHPVYHDLSEPDRKTVRWLGGILRVADGLDRSHRSVVEEVDIVLSPKVVEIHGQAKAPAWAELAAAEKKANLLEECLGRRVRVVVGEG